MILDLLLLTGFLYSLAGAFWATTFVLRNKWKIKDRVVFWIATVCVYLIWPIFLIDKEAKCEAFDQRRGV